MTEPRPRPARTAPTAQRKISPRGTPTGSVPGHTRPPARGAALGDRVESGGWTGGAADAQQVDVQTPGQGAGTPERGRRPGTPMGVFPGTVSPAHLHRSHHRGLARQRDRACPVHIDGTRSSPGGTPSRRRVACQRAGADDPPGGEPARWALTIVTVPDSVVALREGVNPCRWHGTPHQRGARRSPHALARATPSPVVRCSLSVPRNAGRGRGGCPRRCHPAGAVPPVARRPGRAEPARAVAHGPGSGPGEPGRCAGSGAPGEPLRATAVPRGRRSARRGPWPRRPPAAPRRAGAGRGAAGPGTRTGW